MNGEENYPVSLRITPEQEEFLKRINPDSKSVAMRIVLDKYMKQQRLVSFEKYLTSFAFGLILVGFGSIFQNVYISIASYLTGSFMICYSLGMYFKGRKIYENQKGV